MTCDLDVPGYGLFHVNRRTADVEMMIAIERDRLCQQYLKRNNEINPAAPAMTLADLSPDTQQFFGYLASFSQTVVKTPPDFNPTTFLTDWSREDAFEFLGAYLAALTQLEQSFRRGVVRASDHPAVEGSPEDARDRAPSRKSAKR